MAKIGLFTDPQGLGHKTYPANRNDNTFIKKMVEEGHEVVLLHPTGSPNQIKKFNEGILPGNDMFANGARLIAEEDIQRDVDMVIISTIPYSAHHWRARKFMEQLLDIYTNLGVPVFYRSVDPEHLAPKALGPALRDYFPRKFPGLMEKFTAIFSVVPYIQEDERTHVPWQDKVVHLPSMYDPTMEVPIKPKSERRASLIFAGTLGYRQMLMEHLMYGIMPVLEDYQTIYSVEFHGDSFSDKVVGQSHSVKSKDIFDKYSVVESHPKRLFMPYKDFMDYTSDSIFGLHESTAPDFNIIGTGFYHSDRLCDVVQAGMYPLTTPFPGFCDEFGQRFTLLGEEYERTEEITNRVMEMSDQKFEIEVGKARARMNDLYGVDRWWPVMKETLGL